MEVPLLQLLNTPRHPDFPASFPNPQNNQATHLVLGKHARHLAAVEHVVDVLQEGLGHDLQV